LASDAACSEHTALPASGSLEEWATGFAREHSPTGVQQLEDAAYKKGPRPQAKRGTGKKGHRPQAKPGLQEPGRARPARAGQSQVYKSQAKPEACRSREKPGLGEPGKARFTRARQSQAWERVAQSLGSSTGLGESSTVLRQRLICLGPIQ